MGPGRRAEEERNGGTHPGLWGSLDRRDIGFTFFFLSCSVFTFYLIGKASFSCEELYLAVRKAFVVRTRDWWEEWD